MAGWWWKWGDASEAGPESPAFTQAAWGQNYAELEPGPHSVRRPRLTPQGITGSPEKGSNPTRPGGSCEAGGLNSGSNPSAWHSTCQTARGAARAGKGDVPTQGPTRGSPSEAQAEAELSRLSHRSWTGRLPEVTYGRVFVTLSPVAGDVHKLARGRQLPGVMARVCGCSLPCFLLAPVLLLILASLVAPSRDKAWHSEDAGAVLTLLMA